MKYSSNRNFKLWAYTVSHSFLLLRSPMKYPDVEGYSESTSYNIDIEFSAVAYLDIPTLIGEISISEVKDSIPGKFKDLVKSLKFKLYEIKSAENTYYIVAGGYRVGKNKWDTEDRTSNMHLEYDEIIATSAD